MSNVSWKEKLASLLNAKLVSVETWMPPYNGKDLSDMVRLSGQPNMAA